MPGQVGYPQRNSIFLKGQNSMARITGPANVQARRQQISFLRWLQANIFDLALLLRQSYFALIGFAALVTLGTVYIRLAAPDHQQRDPIAALYETLKLFTFQSNLPLPPDLPGRLIFLLIPLLGILLILQSVLNFGRGLLDKSSRREVWQVALASTYREHVIVCGLGRVSLRVVSQLIDDGIPVVIVERNWQSEFVARALNLRVPVISGDAREVATLLQAGVRQARALVCGTHEELLNIDIALTARTLRPALRIVTRVASDDLERNLATTLGPRAAYNPPVLAAPTFAAAAISRGIDVMLPTGNAALAVATLTLDVAHQAPSAVQALADQFAVRVVVRGKGPTRDQLTVIGPITALENLRVAIPGNLESASPLLHPDATHNTIILCGIGAVGYRVAQQLHDLRNQQPAYDIVIVHRDDDTSVFPDRLAHLAGVRLVTGDARDPDVMRAAGIDHAFTVAALTSDDLLNLQIGLNARQLRPDIHLVLRFFTDALAGKLADMFGIHTTYSTSDLAAPTLVAAALHSAVDQAFRAQDQIFATMPMQISTASPLVGCTIAALHAERHLLVIALQRGTSFQPLPALSETTQPGDELTILGALSALTAATKLY